MYELFKNKIVSDAIKKSLEIEKIIHKEIPESDNSHGNELRKIKIKLQFAI